MPASPREVRQIRMTEIIMKRFPPETKSTTKKLVLNIAVTAVERRKILLEPSFFIMWPKNNVAKI